MDRRRDRSGSAQDLTTYFEPAAGPRSSPRHGIHPSPSPARRFSTLVAKDVVSEAGAWRGRPLHLGTVHSPVGLRSRAAIEHELFTTVEGLWPYSGSAQALFLFRYSLHMISKVPLFAIGFALLATGCFRHMESSTTIHPEPAPLGQRYRQPRLARLCRYRSVATSSRPAPLRTPPLSRATRREHSLL